MADKSPIEWLRGADGLQGATWNPITGCSVVSAGCKHCYAMKLAGTRLQHHPSRAGLTIDTAAGPVWNGQVRFNEAWLDQPLRWRRGRMIFVCAHGDLFHEAVPDEWIDRVFAVMALAPQHTFQVLTKRADRMVRYFTELRDEGWSDGYVRLLFDRPARAFPASFKLLPLNNDERMPWPLRNVWLGVSVENQATADERIPLLLKTPAAVRWISAEPLLDMVSLYNMRAVSDGNPCFHNALTNALHHPDWEGPELLCGRGVDWVVAGGESGNGARPMHPDWVRLLRDQCVGAGVPFFFKQWGAWANLKAAGIDENRCYEDSKTGGWVELTGRFSAGEYAEPLMTTAAHVFAVGKGRAGRVLDGLTWDDFPEAHHART